MSEAGPSTQKSKKRSRTEAKRNDNVVAESSSGEQELVAEDVAGTNSGFGLDDEAEDEELEAPPRSGSVKKTEKARKGTSSPGIVYISRLPPGMTPQKVRHLMAKWGDVGKVYAQRRDAPTGYNPNSSKQKKQKHQKADFTEAWVEFLSKSVAKTVAQMLNAQMIGGKKGDKWRDDIWTMRYLSGFKWEMLGEQIAYERQSHQARLRNEISRSKTEQGEYLRNVELARVLEKRKQKKAAAGDDAVVEKPVKESKNPVNDQDRKQVYKQRQAVDRGKTMEDAGMKSVLGNVFG